MQLCVEKLVIPKRNIYKNKKVAPKRIKTDEILNLPTEILLCGIVSRLLKEMECGKIDSN